MKWNCPLIEHHSYSRQFLFVFTQSFLFMKLCELWQYYTVSCKILPCSTIQYYLLNYCSWSKQPSVGHHGCRNLGTHHTQPQPLVGAQSCQRLPLSRPGVGQNITACYTCWQDFYLPSSAFPIHSTLCSSPQLLRSQTVEICNKQLITFRIVLVVAVHFISPWYDPL